MLGDLPGPMEDVGLQDVLDAGPVGGEGELPVGLDLVDDLAEDGGRVVVKQPEPGGVLALRERAEVFPDLLGGPTTEKKVMKAAE
ncbi:hypothetical protein [Streptomyces sp. adm13(2018)]|uniref:hypothetical protein n=1 Tax=Streptomyces sp. adm13(2018) TaxID=2479007 RepID=UPI0021CA2FE6|nr:hypothetical protein [Streptomyces sp. adm13(2018)]